MKVPRTSRRIEERTTFTSGYKREKGIWSRKDLQQKNCLRKRKIPSVIEEIYSRSKYMEREEKLKKYKRIIRRIQKKL